MSSRLQDYEKDLWSCFLTGKSLLLGGGGVKTYDRELKQKSFWGT